MTALLAATLFSLHTANTETMNFISSRSEELAAIGVVGSFLVWMTWPRLRASGLHLLPMAIGALGKILAVMYGPLLFAGAWLWQPEGTPAKARTRTAARQTWPVLAASVVVYAFVRSMDAPEWTGGGSARLPYAWTQPLAWLHYARLFVLPLGLTADSDWTLLPAWYDTRAIAGYAFVAVLVAIVLRTWRRRRRRQSRSASSGSRSRWCQRRASFPSRRSSTSTASSSRSWGSSWRRRAPCRSSWRGSSIQCRRGARSPWQRR